MLIKNQKKKKIILKSKKICESAYLKEKSNKFIKNKIFGAPEP